MANPEPNTEEKVETVSNFFITVYSTVGIVGPIGWYYILQSADRIRDFHWGWAVFIELVSIPLFFLAAPYSGIFKDKHNETEK